jgi:beta-glucuronidase
MIRKILASLLLLIFLSVPAVQSKEIQNTQGEVKVSKKEDGTWQLLVDDKPYFIKGVVFSPVKIGESPNNSTARNWMDYDDDHDGRNDVAFQSWLDKNRNNHKDKNEPEVGDFQLLKDLGANTLRFYHMASNNPILDNIYKSNPSTALQFDRPVNKDLLRKLYSDYGIRIIVGNFLGLWTIGSGASWEEGTDYTNPKQIQNLKNSVRAMVLDNKDEPYVLMWELGNENNIAEWAHCNAKQNPESYAKLIGELAHMIHQLDPNHPVAVNMGDGGIANQDFLKLFAQYAPEVNIVSYNAYRGKNGFGSLWKEVKLYFDRPIFIAEFGTPAYNIKKGEDEDWQEKYLQGCWKDIVLNSAEYYQQDATRNGAGNSIGGIVFDWIDRWYMDGSPTAHNPGSRPWNTPDGIVNEEWYGIMSMGDGSDSLMRQKRKICTYWKSAWGQENVQY